MMASVSQQDIAARAYQLWEQEGRPHGKDLDHWTQATSELSTNGSGAANGASNGAVKPAAKKASAKTKTVEAEAPAKPKRKSAKASK